MAAPGDEVMRVELGVQSGAASHAARAAHLAAMQSELQGAKIRVEQLDAVLSDTQRRLTASDEALNELQGALDAERAAAREQGYAAGLERAEAVAKADLQKQLESWRHSVEEMLRANEDRWRAVHSELSDIVLAAAAKLIGEQLVSPHAVRACVEQLMRETGITAPSRVLIAPSQYEQLLKSGGPHLAWFKERRLDLAPDARVTHGGCILETSNGLMDGRYDVQLTRLRELVAAHYRAGAP
jgi:flagellar biosynthesis/type III secretory pathway protein FliH